MKLRARTTIACPLGVWHRGDVLELPDAMAEPLVSHGYAENLDRPKPPKPAPPAEIQTATQPDAQTAMLRRGRRDWPVITGEAHPEGSR